MSYWWCQTKIAPVLSEKLFIHWTRRRHDYL